MTAGVRRVESWIVVFIIVIHCCCYCCFGMITSQPRAVRSPSCIFVFGLEVETKFIKQTVFDKSVKTGIGISCREMEWNDHNWKKTAADEDRVSDTALKKEKR